MSFLDQHCLKHCRQWKNSTLMLRRNKENFSDGNFIEAYFATIVTSTHYQLMSVHVLDDNVVVRHICLDVHVHALKRLVTKQGFLAAVLVTEVQD